MNSLLLFIWKYLYFIFVFLKDSFAGCKILGWEFFLLISLTMSSYCLLASTVSDELLILSEFPCICMTSHFSHTAFLIVFQHFYYDVSGCGYLHLSYWSYLNFLDVYIFSSNFRKFQSLPLNIFLLFSVSFLFLQLPLWARWCI